MRRSRIAALMVIALLAAGTAPATQAGAAAKLRQYEVTIENLTNGQPLSPPVLATFRGGSARAFKVGRPASAEVEAIAENGNQIPQFDKWSADRHVTDVVDVGAPLTPNGSTAGGFSSSVTVDISGCRGDRLGLVTMLICTNDGITGLSRVGLPEDGSVVYLAMGGYDAGTEDNTELSEDMVDPCSGIGPVGPGRRPRRQPQRRSRHVRWCGVSSSQRRRRRRAHDGRPRMDRSVREDHGYASR